MVLATIFFRSSSKRFWDQWSHGAPYYAALSAFLQSHLSIIFQIVTRKLMHISRSKYYDLTRSIGKRGHGLRTMDAGHRTNDGKDGQTMEKTDKLWKRRTNGYL